MTDVDDKTAQPELTERGQEQLEAQDDTQAPEVNVTTDETQRAQMASDARPESSDRLEIPDALPVLPLRGGTVIFPLAVVPLTVGLERSIRMVDDVMRGNRMLALVAQRDDEPQQAGPDDLYTIGTAAIIHQLMRAPDGTVRLIVQGLERIRLLDFVSTEPYLVARVERRRIACRPGVETEGLRRAVLDLFRRLVALIPEVPDEVGAAAETLTDPRQVAYLVASTTRCWTARRGRRSSSWTRSRRSCGG